MSNNKKDSSKHVIIIRCKSCNYSRADMESTCSACGETDLEAGYYQLALDGITLYFVPIKKTQAILVGRADNYPTAEKMHPNDLRNCLSSTQFKRLSDFMDAELKKIGPLHSIGPFTVTITPTGVGTCVEVQCNDTGSKIDITEVFG